ncbi:MAG: hypothetical protein ACT4PI_15680 [Actinomycetota bacterium]
MNRLTKAMLLLGAGVAVWTAPLTGVRATDGERTTADEPQYLLTALSLGEDRSLDVRDERAAERHREFHEAGLPLQEELRADGSRVSPHDPLLPAVLALPMVVGGWIAAKLTLAATAGVLAAAMLWVAVRRFDVPLRVALLAVATFSLAAPLAVYGTQVYPELPAALAVTVAIGALTGPVAAPVDRRAVAVLGIAVVALPWLAVKYLPVAAALAAVGLVRLWRRDRRALAAGLVVGLGAAALAYLVAHQWWYGGWTAYAAGDHFVGGEFGAIGFEPDYGGRAQRLAGLLVDRGFGLAAWQPAFLLAVPAVAALVRRRPPGWDALAVPLAAGWLTATFVALSMHEWMWPGRQLVVVTPCLVLAVAWWASAVPAVRPWLVVGTALGAFTFVWLTVEGLAGLTLVDDFETTTNPLYRLWRHALPDGRDAPAGTVSLRALWYGALALLVLVGTRSVRTGAAAHSRSQPKEAPSCVLVPS